MTLLIIAALLPAIAVMAYVYKTDKAEPEPIALVLRVFGLGALSGLVAGFVESILISAFEAVIPPGVILLIITYFVGVAAVEEACKFFCLNTVESLLRDELAKVGRCGVTVAPCALENVPAPVRNVRALSFTVKSLRLDAVAASLFGLSRTAAAEQIRMGLVSLNYDLCDRTDAPVEPGDVISLRGRGKGQVKALGGRSKKDRLFVEAEVYL